MGKKRKSRSQDREQSVPNPSPPRPETSGFWEAYKDPRWQKKKAEMMARDEWKCCRCGEANLTLHVHHKYYVRNHKPWEYPDSAYRTLCEACHEIEHRQRQDTFEWMADTNLSWLWVSGMCKAFWLLQVRDDPSAFVQLQGHELVGFVSLINYAAIYKLPAYPGLHAIPKKHLQQLGDGSPVHWSDVVRAMEDADEA